MGTNHYIDKLKSSNNKLKIELEHWKMLAQQRNGFIVISEVDADSRKVEEYWIKEDDVRKLWKRLEEKQNLLDQLENNWQTNDVYDCALSILSEYGWTSSEQTKKEFAQELEERIRQR